MATINLGYRKLFQIQGCEIDLKSPDGTTYGDLPLGNGLIGRISIAPHPSFLVPIPSDMSDMHMTQTEEGRVQGQIVAPPLPTGPGIVYLDVLVFRPTTIGDDIFAGWKAGDETANRVLHLLAQDDEKAAHTAADVLSAMLGLRFHRQWVMSPKAESPFAEGGSWCTIWAPAQLGELIRSLTIPYETLREELLTRITPAEFARIAPYAPVLTWLLKAWGERDSQNRFGALFIALEQLLERYTTTQLPQMPEEAKVIKGLIYHNADPEQRNNLVRYFDKLYQQSLVPPNSISACFRRLADQANFPTKAEDIAIFERARKKRNQLVHEGEEITVFGNRADFVGNTYPMYAYNEYSELDSLVARYVMWALYQEHYCYPATIPPHQVSDDER